VVATPAMVAFVEDEVCIMVDFFEEDSTIGGEAECVVWSLGRMTYLPLFHTLLTSVKQCNNGQSLRSTWDCSSSKTLVGLYARKINFMHQDIPTFPLLISYIVEFLIIPMRVKLNH
jgi:hypothetical protein